VAGTTLYLPVHAKGALFEVGDGHAGQGNGEVDITRRWRHFCPGRSGLCAQGPAPAVAAC